MMLPCFGPIDSRKIAIPTRQFQPAVVLNCYPPMKLDRRLLFSAAICVAILAARRAVAADAAPQSAAVAAAAQQIFAEHCYQCHGPSKQEGELRLDLAAAALKGGETGAVIKPGHADDSLLIEYVSGKGDTVMPPKGKRLTEAEVATLKSLDRCRSEMARGLDTVGCRSAAFALVVPAGATQ